MKFYKLSGIKLSRKIHKFYILLFFMFFYNIAYGQNQPITVSVKNNLSTKKYSKSLKIRPILVSLIIRRNWT